jgi:hypothetical protein
MIDTIGGYGVESEREMEERWMEERWMEKRSG